MPPSSTEIRGFVVGQFSREELNTFCHDYFREVYEDNEGAGIAKSVYAHRLVEYCERRDLIKNLLAALQKERPQPFSQRFEAVKVEPVSIRVRNPKQVFISHAHQDAEFAHRLAEDLRRVGLPVWLAPDSIKLGEMWMTAIDRGLKESGVFVAVLTPRTVVSDWVRDETNVALRFHRAGQMRVLPLMVEPTDVDELSVWLSSQQHIPFTDSYADGLAHLLNALDIGKRAVASPDLLVIDRPFHLELVRVPVGEFLMGSDPGRDKQAWPGEQPQHGVYLDEYYIGRYPVTVAQFAVFATAAGYKTTAEQGGSSYTWARVKWEKVTGANWQHPRGPESNVSQKQDHPVTCVSWDDATAFCKWLSEAGRQDIRLPTEAQWEKAARGGDGRIYPWGDDPPDANRYNFGGSVGDTTPVDQYSPLGDSLYGCADMVGNVWEWCADWFDEKEYERRVGKKVRNPTGPTQGSARVLRGGSFYGIQRSVRCASRDRRGPSYRNAHFGFRVGALPI